MKIGVLGTGVVGRTVAARLDELGHPVTIGTRDPGATLARNEPELDGLTYATWAADHRAVALATFAEAAAAAELVVNASSGLASLDVLRQAGAENLAGKVLLDISNALDFSQGFPPRMGVPDTDSVAERIQREFPDLRVVKSLNTLTASLMVHPETLPEPTSVFVSGDDAAAKATVVALLRELGHTDIIDLGDITTARGTEMIMPLWLRLMGALGSPAFNFKIVR
ncbi:NADPH-dependent F420 reductase [Nocardioides panacisoli]|uniref:NAD(P)-binding domain-containing protein n=1 Tax=Nocardioides panacisoli TaxID=627624 RepID=A0ABP7J778_9ACTN